MSETSDPAGGTASALPGPVAAVPPPQADGPMFEMTLSLNVLHHLGLNLYSSMPAVLSEIVANAWDADATKVRIGLDAQPAPSDSTIVVTDDGIGMTRADLNQRFLHVGYRRRADAATRLSPSGRRVMGRKGIGKLSLLSIADHVLVETAKDGEKNALVLDRSEIDAAISNVDPEDNTPYRPQSAPTDGIDFSHGTRITLTRLKRDLSKTAPFLNRRLSRRFGVIGEKHGFTVLVGDKEVSPADADYLKLAQYVWVYGTPEQQEEYKAKAVNATHKQDRPSIEILDERLHGWIATVERAGQLKDSSGDNLNKISVMVRRKLAQEDLLDEFNEGGLYSSYLIGELHGEFLDLDDEEDIATSSRQRLREDDPRYEALREHVRGELQHIQAQWTDLRNEEGSKTALSDPAILEWFGTLGKDAAKKARSLFGRINQLTVDSEDERRQLFAHAVLAFETMRHRDSLEALENVSTGDLRALASLFQDSMDLEAALYHRIVSSRLAIIRKLNDLVQDNEKEEFLQDHIFNHLWLLDPGWERATDAHMEQTLAKAFADIEDKLNIDEKSSRFDIKYRRTSGMHIIVELKRANVVTETAVLQQQIRKYRQALRQSLQAAGRGSEGVAVVCLVGRDLKDWSDIDGRAESAKALAAVDTRVLRYDELLSNARQAYQQYIDSEAELGRVRAVLATLDTGD